MICPVCKGSGILAPSWAPTPNTCANCRGRGQLEGGAALSKVARDLSGRIGGASRKKGRGSK